MDELLNMRLTNIEAAIAEIKETTAVNSELLQKYALQHVKTEERLKQDYVRMEALPCRDHFNSLEQLDRRVTAVERDADVARTKWASEFTPIQKLLGGAVLLVVTTVIGALLALVILRAPAAHSSGPERIIIVTNAPPGKI